MGMAASQARLLSITARLTNNENTGQAISYSKQRLADQTQQITNEYNEALDATKLTVLTGFNGAEANYEDISYGLMTGMRMASNTKQYVVTDTKGKVLVTEAIAKAYEASKGDFNRFLASLGANEGGPYSISDLTVQNTDAYTAEQKNAATQKIHEAWDKYFDTVGIQLWDVPHDSTVDWCTWNNTWASKVDKNGDLKYIDENGKSIDVPAGTTNINTYLTNHGGVSKVGDGFVSFIEYETYDDGSIRYEQKKDDAGKLVYEKKNEDGSYDTTSAEVYDLTKPVKKMKDGKPVYTPINYEGTTQESRNLYEYAMAITEAFFRTGTTTNDAGKTVQYAYDMDSIKSAADPANQSDIKYYQNIFNKIQQSSYFTYTNTPAEVDEHHLYTSQGTTPDGSRAKGNVQKNPLYDNYTFEAALRDGTLRLECYSATEKRFKSTTVSEDNCIQEVADERAIARAESKYTQDMADLENKDKKLDLELKKLDTEHNALQTEYDSVKNVVDKNVESSFKIFS